MGVNMKRRRKIIVSIATSVDGYIARPDGDVGWLDRPRPKGSYGMGAFFKSIDTILWGRKTYSKGIEMGGIEAAMKASGFVRKSRTTSSRAARNRRLCWGFSSWTNS